jgi:shikimate kinase
VADLYGEANLVFEVIEQLPKEALREAEQRLIDQMKAEGCVVLNQALATGGGGIARNTSVNHCQPKHVRGTHLKTGKTIEFLSTQEAGRNGFDSGSVSKACRGAYASRSKHGGTNVYKGYRWEFVD